MMKFLKNNIGSLLMIFFLIIVGILLLINPVGFTMGIIKAAGVLLILLGILDIVRYFRTPAPEAAKGQNLYSGLVSLALGCFCVFRAEWFVAVFPVLAVVYGILQVLLGLRYMQRAVDALRLHIPLWYLRCINAVISILFGMIIITNPAMTMLSIWVFTGLTMIIEGVFEAVALFLTGKKEKAVK